MGTSVIINDVTDRLRKQSKHLVFRVRVASDASGGYYEVMDNMRWQIAARKLPNFYPQFTVICSIYIKLALVRKWIGPEQRISHYLK